MFLMPSALKHTSSTTDSKTYVETTFIGGNQWGQQSTFQLVVFSTEEGNDARWRLGRPL